jgi:hypothetical protein
MGGGGYALPVNIMTPRYGTHGGSPGAPPTSGAGNPLVNMNAIHVLYCAICNAMCSNPDHHRQMREAGATAGLNPQPPGACPPPRAAAAGSPGGGGDPYLHGLGATELPDSYRRMGNEIYWTIRRTARSIVEYLERTYPGDKQDAGYFHLLTLGQNADTTLERQYRQFGLQGVCDALASDNTVEVSLNTIGATYHALLHGDPEGAQEPLAFRPPGSGGLLPTWAVADARAASKAGYQEHERQGHGWGQRPVGTGGPPLVNIRRRNEPKPPKPTKPPPVQPKPPRVK